MLGTNLLCNRHTLMEKRCISVNEKQREDEGIARPVRIGEDKDV